MLSQNDELIIYFYCLIINYKRVCPTRNGQTLFLSLQIIVISQQTLRKFSARSKENMLSYL
jgi:hypothetical protein